MIPAFIVPVYGRWDLTQRMLDSIDHPVERGLLVDNKRDYPGDLRLPPNFVVSTPPFASLGWGGTLNFGISQMYDSPWWMWCTNDIILGPGDMKAVADEVESTHGPVVLHFRWAFGAMNAEVVQRVGLFDEWSYYPIYFEDTDYAYRCHLEGVPVRAGSWGLKEGVDGIEHSTTTRTDPELSMANNRTWILNEQAYTLKWGGLPSGELHTSPWGKAIPSWSVRPDLVGRRLRRWPSG